jgi:hypothetical protein
VAQVGKQAGLAFKGSAQILVAEEGLFYGNSAAQDLIDRLIDNAHASLCEEADNPVTALR